MGPRAEGALVGYLLGLSTGGYRVGEECPRSSRCALPLSVSYLSPLDFEIHGSDATSTEFNTEAKTPIIIFMPEISKTHMGGTMRLGLRPTVFEPNAESWSQVRKLYGGVGKIWERHRHRYEVNPEFVEKLHASGLSFVGKDEKGERMQILELRGESLFFR
jgi:CTP synthase (UTP-ammonia lyase)